MTHTARTEAECQEFFDDPATLNHKIKQLAKLIKESKHMVCFTGAGISTSAGIADYRSGINTVLDTGAGKWARSAANKQGKTYKRNTRSVRTIKAYPTPSHMALVQLMKHGYLKYLISQNTDGLHRRSGIAVDRLSELHGNSTLETCELCKKEYMRDYKCRRSIRRCTSHKDHFTGRYCNIKGCNGKLNDTIVNFGEEVRYDPFALARGNTDKSDLYLSLGSSLTVAPANSMPIEIGNKWKEEMKEAENKKDIHLCEHKLVVINLQQTPLHEMGIVSLPIWAKIDDVMIGVMKELGLEIPKWYLSRYVRIHAQQTQNKKERKVIVSGVDIDGTQFEVFKNVKMRYNGKQVDELNVVEANDDHRINIRSLMQRIKNKSAVESVFIVPKWEKSKKMEEDGDDEKLDEDYVIDQEDEGLIIELEFYGNYKEPNLLIRLNDYLDDLVDSDGDIVLKLTMDPVRFKWKVPQFHDVNDNSYGVGKKEVVLMKLYKTSYGYDGVRAVLFANNKMAETLPSPQELTNWLKATDKYKILWVEGKTGKEDLTSYTAFYHHLGLMYCYFYDYYIPYIKVEILKKTYCEIYDLKDNEIDNEILGIICEYEGICTLMNDLLMGNWMNPSPFYRNLIITKMWNNLDKFPDSWTSFLNQYSKHRQS